MLELRGLSAMRRLAQYLVVIYKDCGMAAQLRGIAVVLAVVFIVFFLFSFVFLVEQAPPFLRRLLRSRLFDICGRSTFIIVALLFLSIVIE
jgi:hypothetical protein